MREVRFILVNRGHWKEEITRWSLNFFDTKLSKIGLQVAQHFLPRNGIFELKNKL